MRAPLQVLVIPFRRLGQAAEFAVLRRSDAGWWQSVAGGGEDAETPLEAAARETREEVGFDCSAGLIQLDCIAHVPKSGFRDADHWDPDIYVIPEYHFAVEIGRSQLQLSREHSDCRWLPYEDARTILRWDSNRTSLRELAERIKRAQTDPSALAVVLPNGK